MGVGGAVFAAFILFWFIRAYFKRQTESGQARDLAQVLQQRTAWEEKRTQPRLAVSWSAEICSTHGPGKAEIKDISLGGAFVACSPLPLSHRFRIRIELPDGGPLDLAAEVVWSNANVPPERVVHRGMGIRFVEPDPVRRTRLTRAVNVVAATARA
ncbi:MAG: PilZ domain-containing protein [Desulfobacterales bacterium]|nr:PilZ domain-containing protein [Desulfobacterales bacterium]